MKRITLLFLLFFTQLIFAQFAANDVKFFVGSGTETAYLVVDFKDGTDDRSYAWGYRFDSADNPTMADILTTIVNEEPKFIIDLGFGGGFLSDLTFNSHSGIGGLPEYWSTWSGTSAQTFTQNGGLSESLINGKWYGVSYGFGNPTAEAPTTPIPAYSSQWYNASEITMWLGTGSNKSLIVVDFGTETNGVEDSFVFGIQYNGSITTNQALTLIQTELSAFNYTMSGTAITDVTVGSHTASSTGTSVWKTYKGTDLSNWKTETGTSQLTLSNNEWLGLSIGSRRPFIPQEVTPSLSNQKQNKINFTIYPNPTSEVLNIQTEEFINYVTIFSVSGKQLIQTSSTSIDVSLLHSGTYFVELQTNKGKETKLFIKK